VQTESEQIGVDRSGSGSAAGIGWRWSSWLQVILSHGCCCWLLAQRMLSFLKIYSVISILRYLMVAILK
jgi:hypothetical protein